ncbi:hypothetical protein [Calidithermus timidus]|uniref:hypothetical protein n=1 Tax=Calidithermus timidus TaxID=307124 RepID=UPI0014613831|nr:hypothetical protein [Calidithermus timidus]
MTTADGYKLSAYDRPDSWEAQLLEDLPDLVILDRLGEYDSIALRRAMRENPKLEGVPAILVLEALPAERPPWLRSETLARKPLTHRNLRLLINRALYQGGWCWPVVSWCSAPPKRGLTWPSLLAVQSGSGKPGSTPRSARAW